MNAHHAILFEFDMYMKHEIEYNDEELSYSERELIADLRNKLQEICESYHVDIYDVGTK